MVLVKMNHAENSIVKEDEFRGRWAWLSVMVDVWP
jgi:hypothetical protein